MRGKWCFALFLGVASFLVFPGSEAFATCTTILIGKNASSDGTVLVAHNEDMEDNDSGKLWYQPRKSYQPGGQVTLPFETVP
jgi:hypothetical protein